MTVHMIDIPSMIDRFKAKGFKVEEIIFSTDRRFEPRILVNIAERTIFIKRDEKVDINVIQVGNIVQTTTPRMKKFVFNIGGRLQDPTEVICISDLFEIGTNHGHFRSYFSHMGSFNHNSRCGIYYS